MFARLDRPELITGRDRLGVRPLYLARTADGSWVIGSTVAAVIAAGLVPWRLSREGLASFLAFGSVYEPHAIAEGVEPIAPGTWQRWQPQTGWRSQTWWRPPDPDGRQGIESAELVRSALVDAVRRQTPRDAPLGVFISGGTDSSSLAILLSETEVPNLSTFSLSYRDDDAYFDEARYQRQIAALCGTNHHEIVVRQSDASEAMDGFFRAMDQPSIDGFNVFLAAGKAAEAGVQNCFSGAGGDEVFAGYPPFRSVRSYGRALEALALLPMALRRGLALPLALLAALRPLETRLSKTAYLLGWARDFDAYYALRRSLFLPAEAARLLGSRSDGEGALALSFRPSASADYVGRFSALELGNYVRNTLTRDIDAFGRAHAVDVRLPYLDHRLIETVLRVRGDAKVSRATHKPLMQAALRGALPRFTWERPKRGFTLPLQVWLRKEFVEPPELGEYLDSAEVAKVVDAFRAGPDNLRSWSRRWALSVLERWLRSGWPSAT